MRWTLNEKAETCAGAVAAGSTGTGPDLVLAHGWPWSSYSWHRIIPDLAQHFRVHWYDMPGYGQSEMAPENATSLDVQGQVFAEMLDFWGLAEPSVIAHDMGGTVTLRAHLLHDRDYARLVLMNVVALSPWGSEFFDHVGRNVEVFEKLPAHIHEGLAAAYINGAVANRLDAGDLRELVGPWLSEAGRKSFYNQFAAADDRFTDEIFEKLASVRCPVSIIWGELDPWIPLERGRLLHNRMPGSLFDTLPGAGHLPQLETPEAALGIILKQLQCAPIDRTSKVCS